MWRGEVATSSGGRVGARARAIPAVAAVIFFPGAIDCSRPCQYQGERVAIVAALRLLATSRRRAASADDASAADDAFVCGGARVASHVVAGAASLGASDASISGAAGSSLG